MNQPFVQSVLDSVAKAGVGLLECLVYNLGLKGNSLGHFLIKQIVSDWQADTPENG